jgi:hypothetical protein
VQVNAEHPWKGKPGRWEPVTAGSSNRKSRNQLRPAHARSSPSLPRGGISMGHTSVNCNRSGGEWLAWHGEVCPTISARSTWAGNRCHHPLGRASCGQSCLPPSRFSPVRNGLRTLPQQLSSAPTTPGPIPSR